MQLRKAGAAQEVQGARLYASRNSLASSRQTLLKRRERREDKEKTGEEAEFTGCK
ncbi:hypothetical protein [Pseudomonas sp. D1-36]|uniref:hypothetical protein n=1 Tax=Pseudomonas sp. D1-36 TaxID=2817387 RepID=UPI003DA895B2